MVSVTPLVPDDAVHFHILSEVWVHIYHVYCIAWLMYTWYYVLLLLYAVCCPYYYVVLRLHDPRRFVCDGARSWSGH